MRAAWICLPLLLLFISACSKGPGTVAVTGRITRNGQPLALGPGGIVQVIFVPDLPPVDVPRRYPARYNADGTYALSLPPGRYRVAVKQFEASKPDKDVLNNAFTIDRSPLVREITTDGEVDLELSKPK